MSERLPSLGRRGEGWFAVQVGFMGLVAVAGLLGPAWSGVPRLIGAAIGAALIGSGFLVGLRAMADLRGSFTPLPHPVDGGIHVEHGVYRLVRHPMYLAVLLGALGWSLVMASPAAFAATAALFVFLDLKSRREEAWLVHAYPTYDAYRERTRRIVPFVY